MARNKKIRRKRKKKAKKKETNLMKNQIVLKDSQIYINYIYSWCLTEIVARMGMLNFNPVKRIESILLQILISFNLSSLSISLYLSLYFCILLLSWYLLLVYVLLWGLYKHWWKFLGNVDWFWPFSLSSLLHILDLSISHAHTFVTCSLVCWNNPNWMFSL
jgi:hypothetical protein